MSSDIPASAGCDERFPRGDCRQNARWMTLMHPELTTVEGYLVFTDHDGQKYRLEHCWNEAPDGHLVDSTAWAFEGQTVPYRYERDPEAWIQLDARLRAMASESRN